MARHAHALALAHARATHPHHRRQPAHVIIFVNQHSKDAKRISLKTGIPAEVVLAQLGGAGPDGGGVELRHACGGGARSRRIREDVAVHYAQLANDRAHDRNGTDARAASIRPYVIGTPSAHIHVIRVRVAFSEMLL